MSYLIAIGAYLRKHSLINRKFYPEKKSISQISEEIALFQPTPKLNKLNEKIQTLYFLVFFCLH